MLCHTLASKFCQDDILIMWITDQCLFPLVPTLERHEWIRVELCWYALILNMSQNTLIKMSKGTLFILTSADFDSENIICIIYMLSFTVKGVVRDLRCLCWEEPHVPESGERRWRFLIRTRSSALGQGSGAGEESECCLQVPCVQWADWIHPPAKGEAQPSTAPGTRRWGSLAPPCAIVLSSPSPQRDTRIKRNFFC